MTLGMRPAHTTGGKWTGARRHGATSSDSTGGAVALHPARPEHVPGITALVARFAAEGLMLPRSPESIGFALGDFIVAADARGRVLGCGALREYSPSLAEIASLAVAPEAHGGGIGTSLVRALESLARRRGIAELFALTLAPAFFEGLDYVVVDRAQFPEKMRRDCASCARRNTCREICVRRCLPDAPHAFAV